jgi:hypothetical protein
MRGRGPLHLVNGILVYGSDGSDELAPFAFGKRPMRLITNGCFERSGQRRTASRGPRLEKK